MCFLAFPPVLSHCHDAVAVSRGQSICQRWDPPTSTTSVPLPQLSGGWHQARKLPLALPSPCGSGPALPRQPCRDHLVPCPGCDNLQRSRTLQRRWTALQVELTLGRFAHGSPDFPALPRSKERAGWVGVGGIITRCSTPLTHTMVFTAHLSFYFFFHTWLKIYLI